MLNLKTVLKNSFKIAVNNCCSNVLFADSIQNNLIQQQTVRNLRRLNDKRISGFGYKYTEHYQGG